MKMVPFWKFDANLFLLHVKDFFIRFQLGLLWFFFFFLSFYGCENWSCGTQYREK